MCAHRDRGTVCSASVEGVATGSAGSSELTVQAFDAGGALGEGTTAVDVVADDAVVEFDRESPVAVEVVEDGGTSGVVDLRLGVREAVPDDAIGIEKAGDTGRAQVSVRLVPVGPGSPIDGTCGAGAESGAGYDAVLAATCSFDSLPVNVYTVDVTVDGGYYMAQAEDALTVYDTSLGFTTGGGWFYWPGTAIPRPAAWATRPTSATRCVTTRRGRMYRGNLLVIRHMADGSIYRLTSNAPDGLAPGSGSGFGWATFTGKATCMEPGWDDAVGNHQFTVYVEDSDTRADRFWLKTFDKDGSVVTLSMLEPTSENAIELERGNISAHDGGSRGNGGGPKKS